MQRALPLLAFLLGAAVLVLFLRPRPESGRATANPDGPERAADASGDTTIDVARCIEAAYLCAGFAERNQDVVARWPDGTRELRVHVSRPAHEDPALADELQRAAARGIRVWQGQPFPLRIETDERPGTPHIVVRWVASLDGEELGRVHTSWRQDTAGDATFAVPEFLLATRVPGRPEIGLPPSEVERAAAHEMGHALGLPHSDDTGHLMFPDNRSTGLSVDDYRAVEALYRLPAGARLPSRR